MSDFLTKYQLSRLLPLLFRPIFADCILSNEAKTMILSEEIHQAEQTLYKAQLAGDVEVLDTLLADDLLFVGPDGQLYTKEMDLEAHRSRTVSITTLVPHKPTIQLMPQTAIVTVMIELEGIFTGQPAGGKFRYLRVWTKQQDKWKITAGSCTPVHE